MTVKLSNITNISIDIYNSLRQHPNHELKGKQNWNHILEFN